MNKTNWMAVVVFGGVVLLVVLIGMGFLAVLSGVYGGMGTAGRGGMMGSWCSWCGETGRFGSGLLGGVFGLILTPLGLLIPLGLLGLLIAGGIWLMRRMGSASAAVPRSRMCPNCGQPVRADWRNCPYCGELLEKEE